MYVLQARGEPLYVGQILNELSTGRMTPALIYAHPLGATYTAADIYPFYFGSKVTNPPNWQWLGDVNGNWATYW
jgi:hypothetical protein